MAEYNIHEAKTKFSALLALVAAGEIVTIARAGEPIAILTSIKSKKKKRIAGLYKNKIKINDSFFDSMDDEFLSYFK